MVFWRIRKPLAGARVVIATALLPPYIDPRRFAAALRLDEKTPHRHRLAIPRTGGGTYRARSCWTPSQASGAYPPEAARLGLDVTAVELLPTACIFHKAMRQV